MRNAVTQKNLSPAALLFHRHGLRPEAVKEAAGLLPPPLAALRAAGDAGGEFPICLIDDEQGLTARSVKGLVEEAFRRLSLSGDEAARCRKVVRRLEREMASLASRDAQQEALSGVWGSAATSMIADPDLQESDREAIRKDLSRLRQQITVDGPVLSFHPRVPATLLHRATQQDPALAEEAATLVARLEALLEEGHAAPARLEATLQTLQAGPAGETQPEAAADALPTAIDYVQAETRSRLAFFRALQMARLEAEGAYDEDEHDARFEHFGPADLTAQDRMLCPPLLLHLDASSLTAPDDDRLLALLDTPLPLKILVTIDRLYEADDEAGVPVRTAGWRTHLAEWAVASGRVFVLQATAAQAKLMMQGFREGLRYNGSALFCVYTGSGTDASHLSPVLSAVAALSSRVFPAFLYDPGAGDDWATRFRLTDNPQPEQRWPVLEVLTGDGVSEPTSPFTPACFFAGDARLSEHFMVLPSAYRNDALMPLDDYLAAGPAQRAERLPYVDLVDEQGTTHRALCTRALVYGADAVAVRWQHLQERGGIHNSHAARAVAAEKERLVNAFEEEKKTLARQHQEAMDAATKDVARQFAANVAAGLLDLGAADLGAAVPVPEAPAPAAKAPPPADPKKPPKAPPPATAAADDEAPLSFDEPYIDSAECTSCDECLNLNASIFAYDADDKAYIKDPRGGPYRDLVAAAEQCPADIIHPGKPLNPEEPGLEELMKRAEPYL